MKTLRLILGDQLSRSITSLDESDIQNDIILICELRAEATYVKHHKKKIAFLFSAMREFADSLKTEGFNVRYVKYDDVHNDGSFEKEVERAIADFKIDKVVVTEPGEYRLLEIFKTWGEKFAIDVEIRFDNRFLCTIKEFKDWAGDKKHLLMEYFYREMRKKYNILMDAHNKPIGGKWNYDKENRSPAADNVVIPKRISHQKSQHTLDVLKLVEKEFEGHLGVLEPFHFAITHEQAMIELKHFVMHILPSFGKYQDAMVQGEAYMFHSLLSSYINAGLLLPIEVCRLAEAAYHNGHAPLNAVEGFIRQILGWREYIRGMYWLKMPEYKDLNFFDAKRKLPEFYWDAKTRMNCVSEAVNHTLEHAYSHHIQRLMITGNFALIAGLSPKEVCEWYLIVYADAYEWVELPNTLGMALYGDGGMLSSKPYAASGKYINRMSNYCKHCAYDPNINVGEKACPFNSLYWDFLHRNNAKIKDNMRMKLIYSAWEKFKPEVKASILNHAKQVFKMLENNEL